MTIVQSSRHTWVSALMVVVVVLVVGERQLRRDRPDPVPTESATEGALGGAGTTAATEDDAARVREAFATRTSDLWVTLDATVTRTLPDDDEPPRHQRFVVELAGGPTLLVAHNVDAAPRVPLEVGDRVRLHGEYEWNAEGGVLHFTHRRRDGGAAGWVEHDGTRFE